MENATKALTMAASVLISLVIISAVLLVFNNLSNYQNINDQLTRDAHVIEFNNRFETYNRTDVRGSDICSLMNRVLDYNERESSAGIEGSDKGYEPLKLTINLADNHLKQLYKDDTGEHLIKKKQYIIENKTNQFEEILDRVNDIEDEYGQANLTRMINNFDSIFIENASSNEEKEKAVKRCNELLEGMQVISWDTIKEGSDMRRDVYQYYEYIQFKRLHFDCIDGINSGVTYDDNTGRIISMNYESNGKIE